MNYSAVDVCKRTTNFCFLALSRPSLLTKREWDSLGVVCTLLILCATTMPWTNFTGQAYWQKVTWLPFSDFCWERWFLEDVVENVIMFLPFGWCFVLAQRPHSQNCLPRVFGWALALSLSGEFFQAFSLQRSPSMTDVSTNTFGAMIAALQALAVQAQEEAARPFNKDIIIREPLQELSIPVTTTPVAELPTPSQLSHRE